MDAWEYSDVVADQAAAGRLYHEFLRVPDLSAGLYVLEAGATDPQSPHTEDELYYVVTGRARVTVGGETRPVVPGSLDLRGCDRAPHVPRHRGAAGVARAVRSRRGRPRLRLDYSRIRRHGLTERKRQLRAATDLVVAEEGVDVVAGRQEGLDACRPGRQFRVGVVVPSQSEIEERTGPSEDRWLGVLGELRRTQGGTDAGQRRERLVDVPRRVLELHRQWQVRGPGGEEPGELRIVASDVLGDAEEDGPEPLTERPVRTRQPGDAFARVDREGAERSAALSLDREPEVGRCGSDPRRDLVGLRRCVVACCSARRQEAAPRNGPGSPLAGSPAG